MFQGGIKAVVWTDTLQSAIMVAGMVMLVIKGGEEVGSIDKIYDINDAGGRLEFFK